MKKINPKVELQHIQAKNKIVEKIVIAFFLFSLSIIGIYIYWLSAEYDILRFYDRKKVKGKEIVKEINTIKVINKTVESGQYLKLHFDYCKTTLARGEVEVYLVDKVMKSRLNYPGIDEGKPGCHIFDIPFEMPTTIVTRERRVCFTINYHPNPLRIIKEEFCSEKFLLKEVKL